MGRGARLFSDVRFSLGSVKSQALLVAGLFVVGVAAGSAQTVRSCLTGPRADALLDLVHRGVAEGNPGLEIPPVPPEQVRLVRDDSVCVAVSRVLGGYVKSGSFASLTYRGPYVIIRAGPRFLVHDTLPEPVLPPDMGLGATRFVAIDTLRPPPRPGYAMPGACWTHDCLCRSPWTLRSAVPLRPAPSRTTSVTAHLPANTRVDSDTVLTVVDVVGLTIVERPTWSEYLNDTLPAGDSLLTLRWGKAEDSDTRGYVAWWRGLIVHVEQLWDSAGARGARSVREPTWSVWAHMIYSNGNQRIRGWALMTPDLEVTGPNCDN